MVYMNRREFDDRGNQNFFRGSGRNDTNFEMDNEMDNEFDNEFGNVGGINASTCQQLADIIGGMVVTATPVCVVQRLRNIRATILDRRTRSPLALPFALSF